MTSLMTRILRRCLAMICGLVCYAGLASAAQSSLPLDQAARDGDVPSVKALLQKGADPNALNKWGANALTGACSLGASSVAHTQIVEMLLANGADVNRKVFGGTTALNEAAYWGHVATVRVLLKAGADVNAAKDNGYTPLLAAASRGHAEIVSVLIGAGADLDARTQSGLTALHLASAGGFADVVGILERSGANTVVRSATNETYENVAGRTAELQQAIGRLGNESSASRSSPHVEDAPRSGSHDLTRWELLLSFVVTWMIGLMPPLLIRYVLVRKPLSRGVAGVMASLFLFGNVALFSQLGSTNRSHAVLFLIAWFSYVILSRSLRRTDIRRTADSSGTTVRSRQPSTEPATADHDSWWTARRRQVVRRAATAGLLVGVAGSLITYFDWRTGVESEKDDSLSVALNALPRVSTPHSTDRSDNPYDKLVEDLWGPARPMPTPSEACVRAIESISSPPSEAHVRSAAQSCDTAVPRFVSDRLRDYPPEFAVVVSAAPVTAAFAALGTTAGLWLLGWPHAGWRRVAIIAAPLSFGLTTLFGLVSGSDFHEPDIWAWALMVALCGPFAVLGLVVVFQWVVKGFRGAGAP